MFPLFPTNAERLAGPSEHCADRRACIGPNAGQAQWKSGDRGGFTTILRASEPLTHARVIVLPRQLLAVEYLNSVTVASYWKTCDTAETP